MRMALDTTGVIILAFIVLVALITGIMYFSGMSQELIARLGTLLR